LASRTGTKRDAWLVDYQAGLNSLEGQQIVKSLDKQWNQFVLLSAFCCRKPLLQFQFAKLQLEKAIKENQQLRYSIVRPTAFFKSIDGQVENIRKGYPALFFGDGSCAANPISEDDLASFLVDCAVKPKAINMVNSCREVGGPDVPPVSKLEQISLIFDALQVSEKNRRTISIPVGFLDTIINVFETIQSLLPKGSKYQLNFEDVAEIARIVKYYAVEPMDATGEGQVQGKISLKDHFAKIAERSGQLEEIDKMTTSTGVLELLLRKELINN
jgi:divinyl chlorophyllide a 8-vinyl-reductase